MMVMIFKIRMSIMLMMLIMLLMNKYVNTNNNGSNDTNYSNPNNGKPDCETTICMFCADKLMGLYANDITHVNCPTCRTPKELPECRIEAYSVNMNLLRSIDSYLHFENKFFMDMFGIPLNIIQCVQCDYYCSSLNELMNHVSFCKINK